MTAMPSVMKRPTHCLAARPDHSAIEFLSAERQKFCNFINNFTHTLDLFMKCSETFAFHSATIFVSTERPAVITWKLVANHKGTFGQNGGHCSIAHVTDN